MQEQTPSSQCLFCAIASGKMRAHIVHEDADCLAFLDIQPIRTGHVQIIPRTHFSYFDDLPAELCGHITVVGQKLARRMKQIYNVERVAFLFTGGDIPHVHAHVVPMEAKTDITSRRYIAEEKLTFRGLPRMSEAELAKVAAALRGDD